MTAVLMPAPQVSRWSGGQTAQIALWPVEAGYASRDFLWRLSSASVECESSVFTSLPDYNRIIALLGGELTLDVAGETVELSLCQPYHFDGGTPVTSRGRAVDFNLMLRKNLCEGEMRRLQAGECVLSGHNGWKNSVHLVYAADHTTVYWAGGGCVLPAGSCLKLTLDPGEIQRITTAPRGRAILASVWF